VIYEKLEEIFSDIFDLGDIGFKEDLSAGFIKDWDSLGHVRLMIAIESEFDIRFSLEEFAKLVTVKKILGYLVDILGNSYKDSLV
jgi:acyl carrier protein